jgi:hypothetical protein
MHIIGDISEDTFVGWTGPHAWTVNIMERYHSMTELNENEVDDLIGLLKEARQKMLEEKKAYQEKTT